MRILSVLLFAILITPPAHAEKLWGGSMGTGVGTPNGWLCAEGGFYFRPDLSLFTGIGLGAGVKPQASLMLRYRTAKVPVGVGAGFSVGGHKTSSKIIDMPFSGPGKQYRADLLGFGNVEFFHDTPLEGDTATLRITVGMQAVLLGTMTCTDEDQACAPRSKWPYLGAGLVF